MIRTPTLRFTAGSKVQNLLLIRCNAATTSFPGLPSCGRKWKVFGVRKGYSLLSTVTGRGGKKLEGKFTEEDGRNTLGQPQRFLNFSLEKSRACMYVLSMFFGAKAIGKW